MNDATITPQARAIAEELTGDERDAFRHLYVLRCKNVSTAWALEVFLSPTAAYLYLGEWVLAAVSFITLQGFLLWWVAGWFMTPSWVRTANDRIAAEIAAEIRLRRVGRAV